MFKDTDGQKLTVYAWDSATGLPKTGDAANLVAYQQLDDGNLTALGDTSAAEVDATNAKGYYVFSLSQAETNANKITFTGKSTTSGIVVLAVPAVVYPVPANWTIPVVTALGAAYNAAKTAATQTSVDALLAQLQAAAGNGVLTVTSPVSADGVLTLVTGDDYLAANDTAIPVTITNRPELVGLIPHLVCYSGVAIESIADAVVSETQTILFDLTNAQTSLLAGGSGVQAKLGLYQVRYYNDEGQIVTKSVDVLQVKTGLEA